LLISCEKEGKLSQFLILKTHKELAKRFQRIMEIKAIDCTIIKLLPEVFKPKYKIVILIKNPARHINKYLLIAILCS
jgi:hypothetical protein